MRKFLVLFFLVFLVSCSQTQLPTPNNELGLLEPPELTIIAGTEKITAIRGSYSWEIDNGDGTGRGINADSGPPDELVKHQKEKLYVEKNSILTLGFKIKPDKYEVYIWEDKSQTPQKAENEKFKVPTIGGEVIYEVQATWKQGRAFYAFSINVK